MLESRPEAVTFALHGPRFGEDRVVLDLLAIDQWRRPVYLACTVVRDRLPWIWPYARLDGLAWRLVPSADPQIWDVDHAWTVLSERVPYSGLADTTIPMDRDSRAMVTNYAGALFQVANARLQRGDPAACLTTLRFLEEHLPVSRLDVPDDAFRQLRAQAEERIEADRQIRRSSKPSP